MTVSVRRLGDLDVSALGFGAMTLTQVPGYDVERGVRTVHAALDAGITLFDTADCYGDRPGFGVNETFLMEALRCYPGAMDRVVVGTKAGHKRLTQDEWTVDGRPEHIKSACRDSLVRMRLDSLSLYHLHRPDPAVPFADSVGAFRELYDEGLIRRVGLSNVDCAQIEQASEIVGAALVSVQNEYSPAVRTSEPELQMCERLGLAFLAWGPLGGMRQAKTLAGESYAFAQVAKEHGVSSQRVALAWQLARSTAVIPLPGASRPASVLDSALADDLALSEDEMARLEASAPAV